MGIWGYGPYENDGASDMICRLFDPIRKALGHEIPAAVRHHSGKGKRLKRGAKPKFQKLSSPPYYYAEARAAANLVARAAGYDILGGPPIDWALEVLELIRADEGWLNDFRDPRLVKLALNSEISAVKGRIKDAKARQTRLQRKLTEAAARSR